MKAKELLRDKIKWRISQRPSAEEIRKRNPNVLSDQVIESQLRNAIASDQEYVSENYGMLGPRERKRLIGEKLFAKIQAVEPRLAGKITGKLMEMDNTELLFLLGNQRALRSKIKEAMAVHFDEYDTKYHFDENCTVTLRDSEGRYLCVSGSSTVGASRQPDQGSYHLHSSTAKWQLRID